MKKAPTCLKKYQLLFILWVLASLILLPFSAFVLINGWEDHKNTLVEQLDRLTDGFNNDISASIVELEDLFPEDISCNDGLIHNMKKLDYHAKYLTTIAYTRNGNIVCTSDSGLLAEPVPILYPDWVTAEGVSVILAQPIPLFDGKETGIAVLEGDFLAFLDYQQVQSRSTILWLKYISFGIVDGKVSYSYGSNNFSPEQFVELTSGQQWYEDGHWLYSECRGSSECKVIGVDLIAYFKSEPAAVIFLVFFFILVYGLVTLLGGRLYTSMYSLPRQIYHGINEQQLHLKYQPIVELTSNTIIGSEVLCRWKAIDNQWIPTEKFIQYIESNRQTRELTEAVIRKCVAELKQENLLGRCRISINAFPDDIASNHILQVFNRLLPLKYYSMFTIEITEQKIHDLPALCKGVRHLRTVGFSVVIDDFGTGFSNFEGLRELQIDGLKIDKSFIWEAERESIRQKLVENIVSIAKLLELKIVAEGVETEEQLTYLSSLQVDYSQGYLHSSPVNMERFKRLLLSKKA
ncbi:EAL domain-containing protein [Photobacterium minamisatsumaniensis]|uniref:EAL domain-containing protein n=1 Tax=Photobacterium minamisatsumaniensis TaxID=2910233 RepID=UPI003D0C5938